MSVLIKGMDMPKRCVDCPIYFAGLCSVRLQNGKCPLDGRPEWCPLVDVPVPHGKLIDADAIDTRWSDPEVVETLNDAPAVIEEEQ